MNPKLLRRHLLHQLARLGRPGMLGLLLGTAVLFYAGLVLIPEYAAIEVLDQRISTTADRISALAISPEVPPPTQSEQLKSFFENFPKESEIPDWLGKIYDLAKAENIELVLGDYSMKYVQAGRLDEYRITFPLKGAYPNIRKFIAAALSTAPALALESISFKRDKIGDAVVDARLSFLLYVEKKQ